MRRKTIRNRRYLIYAAAVVILAVLAVIFVKKMTRLVKKPAKGDSRAAIYNAKTIADTAKLLETEASATKLSDPSLVSFVPFYRLDGLALDSYVRQDEAVFSKSSSASGILAYRGDALRSSATFGKGSVMKGEFSSTWQVNVGKAAGVSGSIDWRGQALVIKWDDYTRDSLKRSEVKKSKAGLTEVIYAALDGKIYFLDLDDGSYTRDPVSLDFPVTGTGCICPDGTPLYVVGAGDCTKSANSKIFLVNLIEGKVIEGFGERSNFSMKLPEEKYDFYASPLISDSSDCLLMQGENGVIYSSVLAASANSGQLECRNVQKLEYTYTAGENGESALSKSGIAAWGSYLYSCDTKGRLVCTDINNWKTVWVRELGKCISSTPVLEEDKEAGTVFVYIGSSVNHDEGKNAKGLAYITKLNAATGDIIWQREYEARATKLTDGGFTSAVCLGENSLKDYVFAYVTGCDGSADKKAGRLVALNKKTGGEYYTVDFKYYSVSAPVCAYGAAGKGYVIVCDNEGNLFMLDGESGSCLNIRKLGERITTDPVVYEGTLIIGSENKIYGIKLE